MTESIEIIGESSFLFSFDGTKILTDPWFGEPIYGGAWTQFPLPCVKPSQIRDVKYIFISHVHPDHCCIQSIQKVLKVSPGCKFLLMDREDRPCYLTKKLLSVLKEKLAERIIPIKPYESYSIDNIEMWCLPPTGDNALNELLDSSLVLKTGKGLVLFANDNLATHSHADFINALNMRQYLAMLPFSGGSGYPSTYENLEDAEKIKCAHQSRRFYEQAAIEFLSRTSFDYYMPVAGNHILTSHSYEYHLSTSFLQNPYNVIRRVDSKLSKARGIYIEPGGQIDSSDPALSVSELIECEARYDFQKKLFVESISSRITPWVLGLDELSTTEITKTFVRYSDSLQQAIRALPCTCERDSITVILTSSNVYMTVTVNRVELGCSNDDHSAYQLIVKKYCSHSALLCIDLNPRLLNGIVQKIIHINEADAACLLTYYRTMRYIPELYSSVFTILN
jgi:L-ascorbate metabolism protein UlaG (beta-lactamase superfamily)